MFQLSTELHVLGGLLISDSSYHPRWCQGAYHAACPAFAVARFDDGINDKINAHRELLLEKTGNRNRRQALDLG